jgi:tetratricopeptide (TPR) repeat protein
MLNRINEYIKSHSGLGVILFLFIIYCMTAPFTVQSSDTGELISNSFFLRVSHPPGYPLWTLLFHLPIKFFPFLSPFHNGAIFNAGITSIWLGLLVQRFKSKETPAIVMVLGSTLLIWRYAVLPDVFSFHLLFLTLVFLVFDDPTLLEKPWMIFLISLSVANHHTIVFFFPLYVYALMKKPSKKKFVYSLLFGFLSMSIYGLLIFFHPFDYGSWGEIDTFEEVLNHFLRKDYGTFRLHGGAFSGIEWSWLHLLGMSLLTQAWSILMALIFVHIRGWRVILEEWKRFSILIASIILYLLTFLFGGILPLDIHGQAVFERFLLQPILCLFFILLLALKFSKIPLPKWLVLCLLINGGLNITQNYRVNDYHHNTIIEDFALNVLRTLPSNSIYHTADDTQGNATHYVHDVLKFRPDVIHLHPTLSFPWAKKKAQLKYPDALNFHHKTLLNGINFEKYSYFVNIPPFETSENVFVTYFGLVFKLEKSEIKFKPIHYQCDVVDKFEWRFRSNLEDFSEFELSRYYDLEFGRCFFTYGLELLKSGHKDEALLSFDKAVKLSPYSAKYMERLCFIYKETGHSGLSECEAKLEELIAISNQQYYLYKY